jgi:hypothetical protein
MSDEIASDRQRDALTKAGREVAANSPGNGQVAPPVPVEAESGQGD